MPQFTTHRAKTREKDSGSTVHRDPVVKQHPARRVRGFDPASSKPRPDLGSATTTVFENADGTFTAQMHRIPVNRRTADGQWVADPTLAASAKAGGAAQAAGITNPTGSRTTSDSTYVKSGVTQNFSSDNALYVGAHEGYRYNSFIKFDGFASQFPNAYVVSAKLYLDTEYSGLGSLQTCESTPVSVAPVTSSWSPTTLKTFPGPSTGAVIGTGSWAAGVNCAQGRQWGAVPLNPRTLTNWAHGYAPNYGFAVTAAYAEASWKEFNPDNAYLSIEYAADGAGASYAETLYTSPWNNKTGWANVTIQNEGSATWTPSNGYQLGYQIYTVANGTRTLFSTSNYLTPMPKTVAPNKSVSVTATLPALTPGKIYEVCWDMVHSGQYFSGLGIPQTCYALDVVNNAPVVDALFPYNNSTQFTLTPALSMSARDVDAYPGNALTYTFNLYANGSSTVLATSGSSTASTWVVPAGKLAWGGVYFWSAQVSDGNKASAWSQPAYFTVPAPAQPLVTGHLGVVAADATVQGVSPAAGNYSTQAVDASVPGITVGPQLEIRRTYNSMDPRLANAFGSGWSSLLDMRVVPDSDGSGSVVVVMPDGHEERYGRNPDGSYTPPPGGRRVLTDQVGTDYTYYWVRDPSGLTYTFRAASTDLVTGTPVVRISEVSDDDKHVVQFSYKSVSVPQPSGGTQEYWLPSDMDRDPNDWWGTGLLSAVNFTWGSAQIATSTGATVVVPHISAVTLQQNDLRYRTWSYGYDTQNALTSVCAPAAPDCTRYGYTTGTNSGSRFTSMVTDSNPKAYWRLNDAPGATRAVDKVAVNVGTYDATLSNVTLGQPGALAGSPATSAGFNGSSSRMALPDNLVAGSNPTVAMWFKTTQAGGTLFSYQGKPAGTTATSDFVPAIYIGTDGKLRGQFWNGSLSPMTSPAAVNDGKWHYVVLSGAATNQYLYLDGARVATRSGGTIAASGMPYVTVGAGQLGGGWPAIPAGNALGWFSGQVQDVSFLNRPLGLPAVQQQYAAGRVAVRELTTNTLPSGKTVATIGYDVVGDRVTSLTTGAGGTYQFGAPVTTGSTGYYRGAVVSTRPNLGYPMSEASGTIAANSLGLDPADDDPKDGVYNDVVLGAPGIFGASGDTAAALNGKSSYVALPSKAIDDTTGSASAVLWFRTTTAGGVLLSYQSGPIGTTLTGSYVPALYIGNDGKLRGQFWDGALSPMVSGKAVNDGVWHMVALTASGSNQTLWLDGQSQATRTKNAITGQAASAGLTTVSIGAGYIAGGWPAQQAGNPQGYFDGQIAQAALHTLDIDKVAPGAAATLFQAKGSATAPTPATTVAITEPGGGRATITLDPGNGMRTTAVTNALGQTTGYTFDTRGHQTSVTDPNGHTTSRVYDTNGNAIQRTTCQTAGSCQTTYSSFFWNAADPSDPTNGKIRYSADARAGSTGTANTAYRTSYTYTPAGRVATVTGPPTAEAPAGRTTTYTYTTESTPAIPNAPGQSLTAPPGLLASVKDPRGQVTSYQYYDDGQLGTVTEPSGQVTRFDYDVYRGTLLKQTVTSDAYPAGLQTFFSYDDQDRRLTRRSPTTTDAVTGRVHTPYQTLSYDADGNVSTDSTADWGQLTEIYVADGNALVKKVVPVEGQTGLDPTRTTTYTFTAGNQLESVTDPLNRRTSYGYDGFGRNTSRTAADGTVYRYGYSPVGDLETTTLVGWTGDPAAPTAPTDLVLESRAYDPAGRLASATDAMGRTARYTYFDDDRLQSVTDAAGTADSVVTATYTYDAAGHQASECANWTPEDGCSRLTQYTVDAANRITKTVVDPSGVNVSTSRTFDRNDNVLTETLTGGGESRLTTYGYDTAGRLASQKVTNGSKTLTTTMAYDQRGLLTSRTDPRGNETGASPAAFTTTFRYDEAGRRISVTTPPAPTENVGGTSVSAVATALTGYNTFGDTVETQSPTGIIETNTYDTGGQLKATAWPPYKAPDAAGPVTAVVQYGYDEVGQLKKLTDPLGHDVSFTYDQLGNRVATTRQDGRVSRTSFNTVGEVLSTTDATGARTEATYNALGQQITSTQIVRKPAPAAYTATYGYNAAGRIESVKDPLGKTTLQTYNSLDLLKTVTDPLGHTTRFDYNLVGQPTNRLAPDGTASVNVYDQAGRLTAVKNLDKAGATLRTVTYDYDAADNQVTVTDPRNKTVTFDYDALNRVSRQVQPGSPGQTITTTFGYDADGHRTRYTDPNGNITTYTYNVLNLRESKIAPSVAGKTAAADRTTVTRYNAAGSPISETRPGGVTTTNTYDDTGRLRIQTGAGAEAATPDRSFDYDDADRLITAKAGATTETFTYDDRGLMLTSSMPGWNSSFGYDAAGRVKSQTNPSGTSTFDYDDAGNLATQVDALSGKTLTFGYDTVDALKSISYGASGPTRAYGYNDLHELTSDVLKNAAGATQSSVTYDYDDAGHVESKTTTGFTGSAANTYTYDDAGRLASWTAGSVTTPYTYDPAGNRTRAGPTTYGYNERSQLTTATTGDKTATYTYTSRGTTATVSANGSTTTYGSDAYDQQVTAGNATYGYDALGRLTTQTTAAGTRSLTYDDLTNTVASDGTQTFNHTPGGTAISVRENGNSAFTSVDRHGDVTGSFGLSSGTQLSSATYDPYGNVVASSGNRPRIGYQGGWTDVTTGFVNAASRWYNPANGAFTSADTQENAPAPAVNANPYAYGNDDPLGNSDPTGHDACSAQMEAAARILRDRARVAAALLLGTLLMEAHARANFLSFMRLARARQLQNAREWAAHEAGLNAYIRSFNASVRGGFGSSGHSYYGPYRSGSRSASAYDAGMTGLQNSRPSKGGFSITLISENVGWGLLGVAGVGLAIAAWPATVAGAGAAAAIGVAADYALAASDSSCTAANAPPKPKDVAPERGKGPAKATGQTNFANQADPGLPASVTAPDNAPEADALAAPAQAQLDDACFTGALQRSDGTRSAGVWECGAGEGEGPESAPQDESPPPYNRDEYDDVPEGMRNHILTNDPVCLYCRDARSTQVDHIYPLKADWLSGGYKDSREVRSARVNAESNLAGACGPCNASKGARELWVTWLPPMFQEYF
ncbi:LamG-like jellyroll fold domain-containing protein [Nucisporomicrobium flavum]|uniref:LamG-like jellyroll fold domain-containing protein n=1 Tax=Nucisporomicrobium flavum TaxID=2785915 RepID=UPI0027DAF78C|nr:LamG-like jellyroll fold domain-containing protein [Nucisporomicrobium flavum]